MKVVPISAAAFGHRHRDVVAALSEHGLLVDLLGDAELLQQRGEHVPPEPPAFGSV